MDEFGVRDSLLELGNFAVLRCITAPGNRLDVYFICRRGRESPDTLCSGGFLMLGSFISSVG